MKHKYNAQSIYYKMFQRTERPMTLTTADVYKIQTQILSSFEYVMYNTSQLKNSGLRIFKHGWRY